MPAAAHTAVGGGAGASTFTASSATSGSITGTLTPFGRLSDGSRIALLAWSDVGMHSYTEDYSNMALFAPSNTLYAQVVKRGGKPRPVTSGFTVEYSFPGNTYSAGGVAERPLKSNFWQFVSQLFGSSPATDTGLTGRGLAGRFSKKTGYFVASGIPLTSVSDADAGTVRREPYQKARIVVRDSVTGTEVAGITVVVATAEITGCAECHDDNGTATRVFITPTGNTWTNVLALHDAVVGPDRYAQLGLQPLMNQRPVLCAKCHGSGGAGVAGSGYAKLSMAIHRKHKEASGMPAGDAACLKCHPGPNGGLRDVHVTKLGYGCIKCHGTMDDMVNAMSPINPSPRRPWVDEPRCSKAGCHKKMTVKKIGQTKPLFHDSKGHGGIFCAACHDSAHANAKSRTAVDRIKFLELQNDSSQLRKCTVCHTKSKPGGKTKVHGSAS
jgi:hypothetical protein